MPSLPPLYIYGKKLQALKYVVIMTQDLLKKYVTIYINTH